MRVAAFAQDGGACTDIRIAQPARKIRKLQLADVDIIGPGEGDVPERCQKADVVVLGRAFSDTVMRIISAIRSWGGKVVFDLDDNFFDVSPYSPHYKQLGIMPINIETPAGESVPMWQDGEQGFIVKNNRRVRKDFIQTIRMVDCITVTTEPLRKEYSRFHDNVRIVPNAVDFSVWEKPPITHTAGTVRLLYTGAANHQEDFCFIQNVLKQLQDKYPQLTIVFVGTDWKHIPNALDYSRVEVHPWVSIEAYPYLLKSLCCHIGIAPISKTKFNDCRSALKWKEYSALKMATVATDYGPYARSVEHGVTGMLANTQEDWFRHLSELVGNDALRDKMAHDAYTKVKMAYNLDFVVDKWMEVFSS